MHDHARLSVQTRHETEEAKTFAEPYHDPMLPKSRDDVEMRIVYKGSGFDLARIWRSPGALNVFGIGCLGGMFAWLVGWLVTYL